MKNLKLLSLILCVLFVASSCKKSSKSITTTGTITVNIDGAAQTFNVGAAAHVDNTGGFYSLSLIGVQSTTAANSIIVEVTSSSPIVAGTTYTGTNSQADMSYTQVSGSAIYQFDGSNNASNATITVKSISSTNVQGTFSGTLELISGTGASSKALTNGAFNLNIK